MNNRRAGFSLAGIAAVILLLFQLAPSVLAQDQDDQDPPTRAGRLGFVQGTVSFQPGGEGDWLDAVPNRPLTTGDNLWADRDGRAEVQIGSTSIRLGAQTSLTFLDLGNNVTQLRLSVGSLFFRVRHLDRDDSFEVDTPNLAFNVYEPGEYRIDVNENGDQTLARVWRGDAEITGGGNSYRLAEGQSGTFSGTDQLAYDVGDIGDRDDFDNWCLSRDQREDHNRSARYVSADVTGYEDLDDYGQWHNVEGYGNVWSPSGVAGDWAPYRYGHWAYVGPWGWSWVEDEPWGFAPFHYGRWAFAGGGWCWVPGQIAVAPVYSPALVAFVGGGGFSVGVGGGVGVGWFPLGPSDVFVPWYRTSPRYVENVNVTNTRISVTQVTNVYRNVTVNHVTNITYVNQRVNNSVTVVNHDTFVNGGSVRNNVVHVDARQIASAQVTHDVARNIQPSRQSVIGTAHTVRQAPPSQVLSRPVVATRQPVVMNRPTVPGMARAAAPPQVKTVKPAPAAQAQTLQRGARGGNPNAGGRPGGPAGQPNAPENRGAAPRPAAPENNNAPGARGNENAPRPGAPENRPGATENNRPGTPENRPNAPDNRGAAPRPGAPEAQPNAPENRGAPNAGRPGAPDNNRNVPRPGAPNNNALGGRPNDNASRPNAPDNRPNAPDNRPAPPENRGAGPDNGRPAQQVPRPPSANQGAGGRPENNRPEPQQTRPETPQTRPEQSARPSETREQPAPRPQNRPEAAPQQQERNAPRPEARPTQPPPERESRPAPQPRNEKPPKEEKPKDNKNNKDDKDKPK